MEEKGVCWIVNPGCGVEPRKCEPCPAFKAETTCWRFKWKPIANACSYDERNYWHEFFTKQCIQQRCPVYMDHKKEVEKFIALFKYHDK